MSFTPEDQEIDAAKVEFIKATRELRKVAIARIEDPERWIEGHIEELDDLLDMLRKIEKQVLPL